MKLGTKLFISHIVVVFISILIVGVITFFAAPDIFGNNTEVDIRTSEVETGGFIEQNVELTESVSEAVLIALILSGIIAGILAAGISWWLSRRIVEPIREVVTASQTIAAGHYEQSLDIASNDELGELAENFNQMASALNDIEKTRRKLLTDVSHELKTPLASIKGYMEGLEDGVISAEVATYQLVHGEAERLQHLVEDLERLSNAQSEALILNRIPTNLEKHLCGIVANLRPQFQSKSVILEMVIQPNLPPINIDPDRMTQVLTNLLGNSLQYTPKGGKVCVQVYMQKDAVFWVVKDSGIGLAADEIPKIFQRFYRVDKSRSRVTGGNGIGLTIAKHLVESHNGKIWAESDGLQLGSKFIIRIPKD